MTPRDRAVDLTMDSDTRLAAAHQYLVRLRKLIAGAVPGTAKAWSRVIERWERVAAGDLSAIP